MKSRDSWTPEETVRLSHAFKAFFRGNPTDEDCQLIIKWLGGQCYMDVATLATDPAELGFIHGRRNLWIQLENIRDLNPDDVTRTSQIVTQENEEL